MKYILYTKNYKQFELHSEDGHHSISFEGYEKASKALLGDTVEWNESAECCTLVRRRKHPPLAGTIEFCSKTTYGLTSRGYPIYLFVPCNKAYPPMVVGSSQKKDGKNYLGLANFDEWNGHLPRATLQQILGPSGDLNSELVAARWTYHPYKLPKHVAEVVLGAEFLTRPSTPMMTFNIDPPGCKDIDDVLSIAYTETSVELWITIADVAYSVLPDTPIDIFAKQQGQTAYDNGTVIQPMLPLELSEHLCSLIPQTARPGVSLVISFDRNQPHTIQSKRWVESLVCNSKQFDYDTFLTEAAASNIPIDLLHTIVTTLHPNCEYDVHKWVEVCMLTYNIEAAKLLYSHRAGILRKHSGADKNKLEEYLLWDSSLAVLANRSAEYCDTTDLNPVHCGLQCDVYCHSTSPIRRYADLVNQRYLKQILRESVQPEVSSNLMWLNHRQKEGKRYERDIFILRKMLSSTNLAPLSAIVLEHKVKKTVLSTSLWIKEWNQKVTWNRPVDTLPPEPGTIIQVIYHKNNTARYWKDRIVFQKLEV